MNYKKRACSILNWPQWRFERWRVWPCFCFSFSVSSLLCFIIIVSLSSPHLMGWLSLHTSQQPLRVRCCSRRSASHLCCNIRLERYFTHTHTHTGTKSSRTQVCASKSNQLFQSTQFYKPEILHCHSWMQYPLHLHHSEMVDHPVKLWHIHVWE